MPLLDFQEFSENTEALKKITVMKKLTHPSIYQIPACTLSLLGLGTSWGGADSGSCPPGSYYLVLAEFQSSLLLGLQSSVAKLCLGSGSFVSNQVEFFSLLLKDTGDQGWAHGCRNLQPQQWTPDIPLISSVNRGWRLLPCSHQGPVPCQSKQLSAQENYLEKAIKIKFSRFKSLSRLNGSIILLLTYLF